MTSTPRSRVPSLAEVATLSPQQVVDLAAAFAREIDGLKQQLD
jgi:hypothetical protein